MRLRPHRFPPDSESTRQKCDGTLRLWSPYFPISFDCCVWRINGRWYLSTLSDTFVNSLGFVTRQYRDFVPVGCCVRHTPKDTPIIVFSPNGKGEIAGLNPVGVDHSLFVPAVLRTGGHHHLLQKQSEVMFAPPIFAKARPSSNDLLLAEHARRLGNNAFREHDDTLF